MEKKITLATVKSFIKKNLDNLYIKVGSRFDGMTDCVMPVNDGFGKIEKTNELLDHNLGISGAWFVKGSRDHFSVYNQNGYEGIRVSNCCGSFTLAVKNS